MIESKILTDWNTFINASHVTLTPFQSKLSTDLLELPKDANITWCRDSGKTFILGNIAFFLMYRYGFNIIVAAPVLGQSSHIMEEAGRAAYRVCPKKSVHASSAVVKIKGRPGKMVSITGSVDANKQGAKGQVVIIDEKQDVQGAKAAEDFIGMRTRGGCLWLIGVGGSPTSAGEMFKSEKSYISELAWKEYAEWDTDYYEEKVEPAKRLMLPEEFAAHYECKPLDMSGHLLVPRIDAYGKLTYKDAVSVVGVDWGKRLDKTVATLVDVVGKDGFIKEWCVPTGGYDEQMTALVKWLRDDVEYDYVIAETNGVGDGCSDYLIKEMRDSRGTESGIQGVFVTQRWITEQAKKINRMASNGSLRYNAKADGSGMFVKEITSVTYNMLDNRHIKIKHSDHMSSLMLALQEPEMAYL